MRTVAGYWIGGGLVVAAVVGALAWAAITIASTDRKVDGFARVPAPGATELRLEARTYVVYLEQRHSDETPPPSELTVTDARSDAEVALERYSTSLTYTIGGRTGSAEYTLTPPRAGSYLVVAGTDLAASPRGTVAFGDSIASGIVATLVGAFAIGGVLGLAGVVLLIVTLVRHLSARRV